MVGQTANARATNLPAELQSRKRMTALEARLGATLPHLATEANTQAVTVWMLERCPRLSHGSVACRRRFHGWAVEDAHMSERQDKPEFHQPT